VRYLETERMANIHCWVVCVISGKVDEKFTVMVIYCRRFETTYSYHLIDPDASGQLIVSTFQTSVRNYHKFLHNNLEERSS
jgi:hypothetical protein